MLSRTMLNTVWLFNGTASLWERSIAPRQGIIPAWPVTSKAMVRATASSLKSCVSTKRLIIFHLIVRMEPKNENYVWALRSSIRFHRSWFLSKENEEKRNLILERCYFQKGKKYMVQRNLSRDLSEKYDKGVGITMRDIHIPFNSWWKY